VINKLVKKIIEFTSGRKVNNKKINIPLIDSNYITRERLNLKLTSCLEKKITFVSAGIGFGKTSLVSNWLLEKKMNHSWLSLDKKDNEIEIFLTNFVSSLKIFYTKLFHKFNFEYHLKNKDYYLITIQWT
jgi:ATP/maltotriose-dependent transcriptional regulator MalT